SRACQRLCCPIHLVRPQNRTLSASSSIAQAHRPGQMTRAARPKLREPPPPPSTPPPARGRRTPEHTRLPAFAFSCSRNRNYARNGAIPIDKHTTASIAHRRRPASGPTPRLGHQRENRSPGGEKTNCGQNAHCAH
ncbi:hypothetical protein BC834DRAFT_888000, partial [Gloeopeniophorella convolvens]